MIKLQRDLALFFLLILILAFLGLYVNFLKRYVDHNLPEPEVVIPEMPTVVYLRVLPVSNFDKAICVKIYVYTSPPPSGFFEFISQIKVNTTLKLCGYFSQSKLYRCVVGRYIGRDCRDNDSYMIINIGDDPNWKKYISFPKK